ncbi:MAG TPA: efflux RND transporter periplasmic adaptor subunit [Terriglobales bacterium]|nr:efflux RND transporter periplasmic adaptor subunit [Terriglobales bacterium]
MKKYLIIVFATTVFFLSIGCSSEKGREAQKPESAGRVAVVRISNATIPDVLAAVGTVQAAETAQLAPQIMGTVVAVHVREGDPIHAGQVLVSIDPAQSKAGLEGAQAALAASEHQFAAAQTQQKLAEETLTRYDTLFQRKSVSPQEYDEVKARAQAAAAATEAARAQSSQAKAAVAQAQYGFNYTSIRAPFRGVVIERRVDPGALASPGAPVMTVESTGRFRLEASVDEANLRFVHMGETVPVSLDAYPGESLNGKVTQIVPSADPSSRTFLVKLELPSSKFVRSGLFGRAQFSRGERNAILIPGTSVVHRGALVGVFTVGQNQLAELRYVTLGNPVGDRVEVLSGLSSNEVVISSPGNRELGGKQVEVQ